MNSKEMQEIFPEKEHREQEYARLKAKLPWIKQYLKTIKPKK